jgi:hypothetical protein
MIRMRRAAPLASGEVPAARRAASKSLEEASAAGRQDHETREAPPRVANLREWIEAVLRFAAPGVRPRSTVGPAVESAAPAGRPPEALAETKIVPTTSAVPAASLPPEALMPRAEQGLPAEIAASPRGAPCRPEAWAPQPEARSASPAAAASISPWERRSSPNSAAALSMERVAPAALRADPKVTWRGAPPLMELGEAAAGEPPLRPARASRPAPPPHARPAPSASSRDSPGAA